jgi:hypothetical protein
MPICQSAVQKPWRSCCAKMGFLRNNCIFKVRAKVTPLPTMQPSKAEDKTAA